MKKKLFAVQVIVVVVSIIALVLEGIYMVKWVCDQWHQAKEGPFNLANALVEEVPRIKEYFQDKIQLLDAAQAIISDHEDSLSGICGRGDDITVTYKDDSNAEIEKDIADTKIFSVEEKQIIAELFCADSPIDQYCDFYRVDIEGVIPSNNLTDIRIEFIQEDKVEAFANSNYFTEEIAEHWFVCVTINWLFVKEKDVISHKEILPGQGLVRLPEAD